MIDVRSMIVGRALATLHDCGKRSSMFGYGFTLLLLVPHSNDCGRSWKLPGSVVPGSHMTALLNVLFC
eukprot:1263719-Amphidinium_carterae.1